MLHDVDEPFAALGSAQRDELVRLAALLAADAGTDAGLLARSALVAAGRSRRRTAASELVSAARLELIRRAIGPRDRGGAAAGWESNTLSASAPGGFDVLRRELAHLPPRTRTALVLGRWAGWSEQEIAATLRCPTDDVGTEIARGTDALRSALHPASAHRRPVETFLQPDAHRQLREALDGLARTLASSATPVPPPDELRREVTRVRHRRWLVALAALCGAALVAVVVLTGGGSGPPGEQVEATTERSPAPRDVDVAVVATRGSLAQDGVFLAGLRDLPWSDPTVTDFPLDVPTEPDSRRVLFAGDVPGGRWALLVGRPVPVEAGGGPGVPDELLMAWFVGPPGATPEQMTLASYPYGIAPGVVPALLDPRTGTLVVVAAAGDSVEVSQRVDIDADGQDSRSWTPVELDHGIGVAQLDPVGLPWTWATVFRVQRDGRQTITSSPDGILLPLQEQVLDLDIEFPRTPTEEERNAAEWAAQAALGATGLSPGEVATTAQALVPVPEPALGSLALVTIELPSGAFVVTAQWAHAAAEGFTGGSDCGLEVRPAEPPPADGVLAARCELWHPVDGRPLGAMLLVVAPPQVDRVRLYRGDGTFLVEHAVPDGGVLLVPGPEGLADVEAVTSGGVLLGRTRPLDHWMPTE